MRLVIVLILFNCYPMIIIANEIKYNHNSKTIAELQQEVDFTVLTPTRISDNWIFDINGNIGNSGKSRWAQGGTLL